MTDYFNYPRMDTMYDPRSMSSVVRFGFEATEETVYRHVNDLLRDNMRGPFDLFNCIGEALASNAPGYLLNAWMQLQAAGTRSIAFTHRDPCHLAGVLLLIAREDNGREWEQLCNFDPACRVELECFRNIERYTSQLSVTVRIPQHLMYRQGAALIQPEIRPVTVYTQPFAVEPPQFVRETDSQVSLSDRQYKEIPQGELAPRKTKRVSVSTTAPGPEAESPRRLKLRRGREN